MNATSLRNSLMSILSQQQSEVDNWRRPYAICTAPLGTVETNFTSSKAITRAITIDLTHHHDNNNFSRNVALASADDHQPTLQNQAINRPAFRKAVPNMETCELRQTDRRTEKTAKRRSSVRWQEKEH